MPYKTFLKNQSPDIRYLFDMKEVIFDQDWLKKQKNTELYYMYRGMGLSEDDKKKIEAARLRYDITVIPPLMLGKEFNKTAGHYHCEVATGISYPEIYEVLSGEAYYLMQRSIENNSIRDAYFVHAVAGDKVIIPPNYGHFTINASDKNLVMANWVCLDCVSDYSEVKEKGGACYYAVKPTPNPSQEGNNKDNSKIVIPTGAREARASRVEESVNTKNFFLAKISRNTQFIRSQIPRLLSSLGMTNQSKKTLNINWLENKNYQNVPELRKLNPTNFSEFGLEKNKGMYGLVDDLGKLDFLVKPEEYKKLWERILG